jgi:hypothetical protein
MSAVTVLDGRPCLDKEEPLPELIKQLREIMGQFQRIAVGCLRGPHYVRRSKYPLRKMIRFAATGRDENGRARREPLRRLLTI